MKTAVLANTSLGLSLAQQAIDQAKAEGIDLEIHIAGAHFPQQSQNLAPSGDDLDSYRPLIVTDAPNDFFAEPLRGKSGKNKKTRRFPVPR